MLEPFSYPLIDCRGRVQRMRSLPLSDRAWFLQMLELLQARIEDQDFRTVYDSDPTFRACVNECLELHGLSPAWVDSYQATRLLFGMGDEPAILLQLNFPPKTGKEDESVKLPNDIDPEAYNTAALWGSTESLAEALALRKTAPWREVEAIMKARAYQLKQQSPDGSSRSDADLEHGEGVMNRLLESGKLQELLDNARNNALELEELPDDYLD